MPNPVYHTYPVDRSLVEIEDFSFNPLYKNSPEVRSFIQSFQRGQKIRFAKLLREVNEFDWDFGSILIAELIDYRFHWKQTVRALYLPKEDSTIGVFSLSSNIMPKGFERDLFFPAKGLPGFLRKIES